MDLTRLVLANKNIKSIKESFAQGNASHAYIIEGEESFVRRALLVLSAIALCPQKGCMMCPSCLSCLKGVNIDCVSYPDLKDHDRIKVEDINDLTEKSGVRPQTGESKAFLIDATKQSYAPNWQHKLLKVLEEPFSGVHIFIGVTNAGELLPTVRSRCFIVPLEKTPIKQIADYFISGGFSAPYSQLAAALSQGNSHKAEQILLDKDYLKMCEQTFDMFVNMASSTQALYYVERLSKYEDKRRGLFTLMQTILLDSVKKDFSIADLEGFSDKLQTIAAGYSPLAVSIITEEIDKVSFDLDKGANFSFALDYLIMKILEVKYKCRQS